MFGSSYWGANHFESNWLDADRVVLVDNPVAVLDIDRTVAETEKMAAPIAELTISRTKASMTEASAPKAVLSVSKPVASLYATKPTATMEEA